MANVLIVGASAGIGAALGRRLAGEHRLWTASRTRPESLAGSWHQWDASAAEPFPAEALPGELHGLVYCPGNIRLQPFSSTTPEAFREDFDLNLSGAVRVLQAALPALQRAESASVVLFSSVAASLGMPLHASVAAAKGAVEGLTRALAAEWAPRVRVNAIAPSLTDTRLATPLLRSERQRTAAAERHPLGRTGTVDDAAAAAAFLLSAESAWVTGQILPVDGGLGSLRLFR
jgi:NAD(P)-dependent dehydrogenase (short-subunit alcohol dehydrogenase family)